MHFMLVNLQRFLKQIMRDKLKLKSCTPKYIYKWNLKWETTVTRDRPLMKDHCCSNMAQYFHRFVPVIKDHLSYNPTFLWSCWVVSHLSLQVLLYSGNYMCDIRSRWRDGLFWILYSSASLRNFNYEIYLYSNILIKTPNPSLQNVSENINRLDYINKYLSLLIIIWFSYDLWHIVHKLCSVKYKWLCTMDCKSCFTLFCRWR